MSKPWDVLRVPENKKPPIGRGTFSTGCLAARMTVDRVNAREAILYFGVLSPCPQIVRAKDCRELSEFFTELADQLEGK